METSGLLNIIWNFAIWVGIIIFGLLILAILGFGAHFWVKNKAYKKYKVIVYERVKNQAGQDMPVIIDRNESGAILYDKKMKKYFFNLKKAKIKMGEEELKSYDEDRDLDVPHIPMSTGGVVCFVERLGVRKYAFGKAFSFGGDVKVIVSNADCAEAIRAYDMNAKTYGNKNHLGLVVAGYITVCVLILILMIVLLNKFDTLKEVAVNFNAGASQLLQAKSASIASNAPV